MRFTEIPDGTKKICSGCFTKLNRKIGQVLSDPESVRAAAAAAAASAAPEPKASATKEIKKEDTSEATSKPAASGAAATSKDGAKWSDDEVEAFKTALRAHGKNWSAITEAMTADSKLAKSSLGPKKTAEQAKSFFFTHRKQQGLDKILIELKRVSVADF